MATPSMTLKAARWSAEHPWRAVLIWVLFVAAAVGIGATFPTRGTTNADYRIGDSGRADQLLSDSGLAAPMTENILITPAHRAGLDTAETSATAVEIRQAAQGIAV